MNERTIKECLQFLSQITFPLATILPLTITDSVKIPHPQTRKLHFLWHIFFGSWLLVLKEKLIFCTVCYLSLAFTFERRISISFWRILIFSLISAAFCSKMRSDNDISTNRCKTTKQLHPFAKQQDKTFCSWCFVTRYEYCHFPTLYCRKFTALFHLRRKGEYVVPGNRLWDIWGTVHVRCALLSKKHMKLVNL